MFDVKTLKATPVNARRLVKFSKLNRTKVSDQILELAKQDLFSESDFADYPFKLPANYLTSIQHIEDWNGRAVILGESLKELRNVALARLWKKSNPRILILTSPSYYSVWANKVKVLWPDSKISVFGNPRYHKAVEPYPEGVEFKANPDFEADIFVTSSTSLIWHDFFSHVQVNDTIVEEFESPNNLNNKWQKSIQAIFQEVPSPTFLQGLHQLPTDNSISLYSSLEKATSKANQYLLHRISDLLWGGFKWIDWSSFGPNEVSSYLAERSYRDMKFTNLMNLFGFDYSLLRNRDLLTFYSPRGSELQSPTTLTDGFSEYTIEELVDGAFNGNGALEGILGDLRGTRWASLKAAHIKEILSSVGGSLTRTLILTENNNLVRSVRLMLDQNTIHLATSPDREYSIERFFWPNVDHRKINYNRSSIMRGIQSLIVTLDDLINNPQLLEHANFLILGEVPTNPEHFKIIKEATKATGTQLLMSVIRKSFEDMSFDRLKKL